MIFLIIIKKNIKKFLENFILLTKLFQKEINFISSIQNESLLREKRRFLHSLITQQRLNILIFQRMNFFQKIKKKILKLFQKKS